MFWPKKCVQHGNCPKEIEIKWSKLIQSLKNPRLKELVTSQLMEYGDYNVMEDPLTVLDWALYEGDIVKKIENQI